MKKHREVELDILRILALLAVISVHSTGMGTEDISVTSVEKQILIFFDSIVTWQIPVYVMISGRFFLDPERDMPANKLGKAISRIIIAFVFWNIIYQVFYCLTGQYADLNWKGVISEVIKGPYHFWYLFMIVCLYAITPFLRLITKDKKLMEYFILLFFIFESLVGYGVELPGIGNTLSEILTSANFHFALGYSGYYILGYYLQKYGLPNRLEFVLYGIAIILMVMASVATLRRSIVEGANYEWYTGYLKPNIIIVSSAIYLFFTKRVSRIHFAEEVIEVITKLSEYSFGVYLIHALILTMIGYTGLTPVIMHPVIVLGTFMICSVIIGCIRKISFWGKRIT